MGDLYNLPVQEQLSAPKKKRAYVERLFADIAPRYQFVTRALSFGRDRAWKRQLVSALPARPSPRCVDIACGTGDLTRLLALRYPDGEVYGLDVSAPMLRVAQARLPYEHVNLRQADMCDTAFQDGSVDVVTGGYALRNAPDLAAALQEAHRILKPGGTAAFLDFSKPVNALGQKIVLGLLSFWGGFWGLLLHAQPKVYSYIAASLYPYPDRQALRRLVEDCGFVVVDSRKYFFGITEALWLRKDRAPAPPQNQGEAAGDDGPTPAAR